MPRYWQYIGINISQNLLKISNIAPDKKRQYDILVFGCDPDNKELDKINATNHLKIVSYLNFNIQLIELLIEQQIVPQLIIQLFDRSYFWDIGHP